MITDSQFAVYARVIYDSEAPTWMINGHEEWRIEKALRLGYLIALADIIGRKFEIEDSLITSIEKEHNELNKINSL